MTNHIHQQHKVILESKKRQDPLLHRLSFFMQNPGQPPTNTPRHMSRCSPLSLPLTSHQPREEPAFSVAIRSSVAGAFALDPAGLRSGEGLATIFAPLENSGQKMAQIREKRVNCAIFAIFEANFEVFEK